MTAKYLNAWSLESGTLGSVALEEVCLWRGGALGFQKPKQGLMALSLFLPSEALDVELWVDLSPLPSPPADCHAPHHDSNGLNLCHCESVPNKCFLYKSSYVMVSLEHQ